MVSREGSEALAMVGCGRCSEKGRGGEKPRKGFGGEVGTIVTG